MTETALQQARRSGKTLGRRQRDARRRHERGDCGPDCIRCALEESGEDDD